MKKTRILKNTRIFIFLLCIILLITSVSSFEFDNVKSYDKTTNTISITNAFGIKAFGLGYNLMEWQRTTPNPNPVIRSASDSFEDRRPIVCYKNLNLDYTMKKSDLFTGQEFYNLAKGKVSESTKINKDFDWRIKVSTPYEDIKKDYECSEPTTDKDGVIQTDCVNTKNSTVIKYNVAYKPIKDLNEIKIGDEVCLFTTVKPNEHGEQIPEFFGQKINEDSEWDEGLSNGLLIYYNFSDSNTDIPNGDITNLVTGINNQTTAVGTPFANASGIIGGCMESYGNEQGTYGAMSGLHFANEEITSCGWYYPDGFSSTSRFLFELWYAPSTRYEVYVFRDGSKLQIQAGDNAGHVDYWQSTDAITLGQWNFICIRVNTATEDLMASLNGNNMTKSTGGVNSAADISNILGGELDLLLPRTYDTGLNGKIDEFGIWNRTLTDSEITQLYNGGTGITYSTGTPDNPPTVTLNSPEDYYNSSVELINFNCSATDDFQFANLTLYVDNLSLHTVTDGVTYIENTYASTIPDGNYSWNCYACDNASQCSWASSNYTFTVDTPPYFTDISNQTIYDNAALNYQVNASDNSGAVNFAIDDTTNFSIGVTTGIIQNITPLTVGIHTLNITINDTRNQLNTTLWGLTVLSSANPVNVALNSPEDNLITTNPSVTINCSGNTTGTELVNYSVYINGAVNSSDTISGSDTYEKILSQSYADGDYEWTCRFGDSGGFSNFAIPNYTFTVDTTPPAINIVYPTDTSYTTNVTNLNYTFTETNPSACWYSTDNGATNSSATTCGTNFTITGTEGTHTWTVYINDTAGSEGSDSVTFSQDSIPPVVNITNPANDTNIIDENLEIDYTYIEAFPDSCWYNNNNGANTTITCGNNITTETWSEGDNTVTIFMNDTSGGVGSDSVYFSLDTSPPNITITQLADIDYHISGDNLTINYTMTDTTAMGTCFLEYAGENRSIDCSSTGTYINATSYDYKDVTIWANDSYGNSASQTMSWNYFVFQNSVSYNPTVLENSIESFILNFSTDFTPSISQLVYNGTGYTQSITSIGGGEYRILKAITIPSFPADTNTTFYFNVTFDSGETISTNEYIQFVQASILDNCSTYTNELFNLSLYDERLLTPIYGDIETDLSFLNQDGSVEINNLSISFSNVTSGKICSNTNLTGTGTVYNMEIRYSSPNEAYGYNFVPEFYNVQEGTSDSFPLNINLYDLNTNESTEFTLRYRDNDYVARAGVLLQIQRKYVSEGIYRTVEIPITSNEGTAIAHLDKNNYKYRIIATLNGEVLNSFDNPSIICESELTGVCTINLNGKGSPDPYQNQDDIQDLVYSITQNGTKIYVDYAVPSGESKTVNVAMTQSSPLTDNNVICNTTLISSSGSFECNANSTIGDSEVLIEISFGDKIRRAKAYFQEDLGDYFLLNNYIIGAFLLILLITMMVSSPKIMVAVSTFGIAILGLLFLIKGSSIGLVLGTMSWLIVAGILILLKINKKDET